MSSTSSNDSSLSRDQLLSLDNKRQCINDNDPVSLLLNIGQPNKHFSSLPSDSSKEAMLDETALHMLCVIKFHTLLYNHILFAHSNIDDLFGPIIMHKDRFIKRVFWLATNFSLYDAVYKAWNKFYTKLSFGVVVLTEPTISRSSSKNELIRFVNIFLDNNDISDEVAKLTSYHSKYLHVATLFLFNIFYSNIIFTDFFSHVQLPNPDNDSVTSTDDRSDPVSHLGNLIKNNKDDSTTISSTYSHLMRMHCSSNGYWNR